MTTAIEMVSYKIAAGTADEKVEKAQQQINDFCMQQPGFIYRSVSKNDDQKWFDIVYWQNMDAAMKASEAFEQSPVCKDVMEIVAEDSVTMTHMNVNTEIMGAISAEA